MYVYMKYSMYSLPLFVFENVSWSVLTWAAKLQDKWRGGGQSEKWHLRWTLSHFYLPELCIYGGGGGRAREKCKSKRDKFV